MATQWYYAQNGQQRGPLAQEQLQHLLASGAVKPTDLVWSEGLPAWTPAQQVPGLIQAPAYAPPAAPAYAPPPPAYAPPPAPAYAPPAPAFAAPQAPYPGHGQVPVRPAGGQAGLSEEVVDLLRQTKPWVRFLSVLGFIGLALLVLACLVMLLFPMGPFGSLPVGPRIAAAFAYLLMGLVYFPAVLYLHRFASQIGQLSATGATQDLEDALRSQKSFWKYVGILTLVMIILYILILVGVLLFAGAAFLGR